VRTAITEFALLLIKDVLCPEDRIQVVADPPARTNQEMKRRFVAALTLVEILVVIAISLCLMIIVSPIIREAKLSAKISNATSAMRQMGQARTIYLEQSREHLPIYCETLVRSGLITDTICGQGFESSRTGLANELTVRLHGENSATFPITAFRNSFVTRALYTISPNISEDIAPSSGWALNFEVPAAEYQGFPADRQQILILRYDTSVSRRVVSYESIADGSQTLTANNLFK